MTVSGNAIRKLKIALLGAAAVLLVVSYSFLTLTVPLLDNSPDESANRHFSELFSETGTLWIVEQMNFLAPGMIHPRSVTVQDEFLLPGGFIGLPVIFGGLAKGLGVAVMPFLTAIIAVLGAVGFGMAVGGIFGRRSGMFAAILLAVHPDWWYQASRPFMPNAVFLSFVMIAAGLYWGKPLSKLASRLKVHKMGDWSDAALAGVMLGLALAVRPTEIYWLAIAALCLLIMFGWRRQWRRILAGLGGCALALLPFLFLNRSVYGSWLASGYGSAPTAVAAGAASGSASGGLLTYLFPLGFSLKSALHHWLDFGMGLFAWWWVLVAVAVVGLVMIGRRQGLTWKTVSREDKAVIAIMAAVGAWLVFFYGSWTVRDNPNASAVTIGSSYLRYWLPIFVLSVVPVVKFLDWLSGYWKRGLAVTYAILAAVAIASGLTVFLSPQEGLLAIRKNLRQSAIVTERVLSLTEPGSLIVVDRDDKFLWPDRPVIVPLRSEATWSALAELGPRLKRIYYLGITLPPEDMNWLNQVKLPPLKLRISSVADLGDESLYVFEYANDQSQ